METYMKGISITAISDLHGYYPKLEGGDLLIIAGDLTGKDTLDNYIEFCDWLSQQPYREKIVIAGNHDNRLKDDNKKIKMTFSEWNSTTGICKQYAIYLCDSATEFEGLKIWGSPWTKTFPGINPKCKAFTVDTEEELAEKWALIPDDTDILITHSPPYLILDECRNGHVGSKSLRIMLNKIRPKVHVFGHIHENGGQQLLLKHEGPNTICVNASHVNEHYEPVNKPIRIIL